MLDSFGGLKRLFVGCLCRRQFAKYEWENSRGIGLRSDNRGIHQPDAAMLSQVANRWKFPVSEIVKRQAINENYNNAGRRETLSRYSVSKC